MTQETQKIELKHCFIQIFYMLGNVCSPESRSFSILLVARQVVVGCWHQCEEPETAMLGIQVQQEEVGWWDRKYVNGE